MSAREKLAVKVFIASTDRTVTNFGEQKAQCYDVVDALGIVQLLTAARALIYEMSGPDGAPLTTGEQTAVRDLRAAIAEVES